ncbi:MAG: GSU3529 family protein [Geoalkalibacter sp.]|jgi:hypothetical protein|uniref:GSU3529 family protein n=1 Tax=Geoalkalibacter sp. TaxID=3041440 RepID=UPI002A96D192|nr:hypothetical protein [Thermodesulfobacteriota bacterium]
MDIFVRLRKVVHKQNSEGELPDFVVPLLLKVADNPSRFEGREKMVETLVQAVDEYETYSNVCCEKIGFSLEDIHRILDKLRVSY